MGQTLGTVRGSWERGCPLGTGRKALERPVLVWPECQGRRGRCDHQTRFPEKVDALCNACDATLNQAPLSPTAAACFPLLIVSCAF